MTTELLLDVYWTWFHHNAPLSRQSELKGCSARTWNSMEDRSKVRKHSWFLRHLDLTRRPWPRT